jgi:hypothetical protein
MDAPNRTLRAALLAAALAAGNVGAIAPTKLPGTAAVSFLRADLPGFSRYAISY